MNQKLQYDVAVSFAGEDRIIVEELVDLLVSRGISVFYDSQQQAQLWGKDLYQYLDEIYSNSAKFCIIFVSESYIKKAWPKHELKSAQSRAFKQSSEYILPIKLDDTELPGIAETLGYIDARNTSVAEIASFLITKLKIEDKQDAKRETNNAKSKRKVFFSFHYQRDIWRVNQIRNALMITGYPQNVSLWEEAKRKGDVSIKKMIDKGIENTSVTIVCIGAHTAQRKYVNYEIEQSIRRGNIIVCIQIHHLIDQNGNTDPAGAIPSILKTSDYKIFQYTDHEKLVAHIEEAAKVAGK